MAVKNHILRSLRIDAETNNLLREVSNGLDITIATLVRMLLVRSLNKLKADALAAGGYDKLDFTIRSN